MKGKLRLLIDLPLFLNTPANQAVARSFLEKIALYIAYYKSIRKKERVGYAGWMAVTKLPYL